MLQIDLKQKALKFRVLWLLKRKALPSREEQDISLPIVNSRAHFILACYMRIINLKCISGLNTHSNDFIRKPSILNV